MQLLLNKVVLLTGGTEGIGYECAKAYLRAGAKLSVISNNEESLRRASANLGKCDVLFILADVSDAHGVEDAVAKTVSRFGKIDVVHNNAGISTPSKKLCDTDEEEWNRLFDVNVKGIYYTTRAAIGELKKTRGNIINTGSLVAEIGQEIHAAYTATKGAIHALTKSMALDYAAYGIRVNAVAPAGVWTPMLKDWSHQQPDPALLKNTLMKFTL